MSLLCISTLLVGTHFFLLGQEAAAIVVFSSTVRFFVSIWYVRPYLWVVFSLLGCVPLIWFHSSADIFIAAVNVLFSYATFQPTDKLLRLWMAPSIILLIGFNIHVGSPMAVLLETVFLTSNVVGYIRYYGLPSFLLRR